MSTAIQKVVDTHEIEELVRVPSKFLAVDQVEPPKLNTLPEASVASQKVVETHESDSSVVDPSMSTGVDHELPL